MVLDPRPDLCNLAIGMRTALSADGSAIVAENARPPIDGGTVLITGASAGIGGELAVQLAPRARMLILLARRAGRLDELRTTLLARHPQLQVLTLPSICPTRLTWTGPWPKQPSRPGR